MCQCVCVCRKGLDFDSGSFYESSYDPPTTIFNRRNEVWLTAKKTNQDQQQVHWQQDSAEIERLLLYISLLWLARKARRGNGHCCCRCSCSWRFSRSVRTKHFRARRLRAKLIWQLYFTHKCKQFHSSCLDLRRLVETRRLSPGKKYLETSKRSFNHWIQKLIFQVCELIPSTCFVHHPPKKNLNKFFAKSERKDITSRLFPLLPSIDPNKMIYWLVPAIFVFFSEGIFERGDNMKNRIVASGSGTQKICRLGQTTSSFPGFFLCKKKKMQQRAACPKKENPRRAKKKMEWKRIPALILQTHKKGIPFFFPSFWDWFLEQRTISSS